jgi:tetratricopeptide (TPR) repeat protein
MTSFRRYLFKLSLLACLAGHGNAQVKVWQGTLTLPVYDEGKPDPNPPFDQLSTSRFNYPYTLRTNLTDRRMDRVLRAIFLENEYLKCSVLPDLGGHLYTCIDQINGQPMFYANPSIKKANIGYRGAWAAFGVEYNFPVSHNWMSLSPIDFAFAQNADGSASVTVGNVDRVYGMEWSVEMVLRPKSTILEQRVTLSNRSEVRHRFYWWNNAGVQVWDDSHVEYPMRFAASHGFTEVQPWPVDASGKDLSVIRNQTDGPVSLFVHGSREPFMGVWNPHTNSGTVHFAPYDELPGKKTWSWGGDADGLDWRKALSDNDSAYVEVQSGLFRNQETYAFLEPLQTIRFAEYWMPAREIGGITRANLSGVLDLSRKEGALVARFNANEVSKDVTVSVWQGAQRVWNSRTDLIPEHTWSAQIPLANPQQKCAVEFRDPDGKLLMRHVEGEYDWTPASEVKLGPQASYQLPPPNNRSEDDWLQLGTDQELNGRLLDAYQTYTELLRRDPDNYAGQKAAGRLAVQLLHYAEAIQWLGSAQERNTTDGEVAYYLGLAYVGLQDALKARQAFEVAYRLPDWRAAAALELGEWAARAGDWRSAEEFLQHAAVLSPQRAMEELVAVRRVSGRAQDARELAEKQLPRFALSYFLLHELGRNDLQHLANDNSRILNIAREYMRLGMYQPALEILSAAYPAPKPEESEPGAVPPSRDPMLVYYRAYCKNKLHQPVEADLKLSAGLPTDYVFPSSAEDLRVLHWVNETAGDNANAHYLLGTLYFSRAFIEEALSQWNRARELNPAIPVLDASMGLALLHTKRQPEAALTAFRRGIQHDRSNEVVYLGADQALSMMRGSSQERVEVLKSYPDPANMPAVLVYELALNLAESGQFDQAVNLFKNRFFAREEGGTNVRQVWIELQLQRALDLAKKGHCDEAASAAEQLTSPVSGISFTQDGLLPFVQAARTQFLLGNMYSQCGRGDEGRKHLQTAAQKEGLGEVVWAWKAAKESSGFDQQQWSSRLRSALEHATSMAETSSYAGWWVYNSGLIERALGDESAAQERFKDALLLPDRLLSYHLTREAMAKQ